MEHIPFPSIEQFRTVIKTVQSKAKFTGLDEFGKATFDKTIPAPILSYQGTVKLHGTNASVVMQEDGSIHFQSRNSIITPENDHFGFATWAQNIDWASDFFNQLPPGERILYGEWCGQGIQRNVAISQLKKMFVIFKIKVNGVWFNINEYPIFYWCAVDVYNIVNFQTFNLNIDFENPQASQNELIRITELVENECPVGKSFGVSGVGEGVVWSPVNQEYYSSKYVFKVKGEKHSVSKVKTLAAVDTEKMNSIAEFVDSTVTENRLQQGLAWLTEQGLDTELENTGAFIRWVYNDIVKEESDTIEVSKLSIKEIGYYIAKAAKTWFFKNLS